MSDNKEAAGELPALPPKPADRLSIQYGPADERTERVLFFSFLRQNSLLRFIESPTDVINLRVNPDLSETALRIMLADKGGAGQMLNFELDEDLISYEDVEAILEWVEGQMTHFFMKRFRDMAQKAQLLEPLARDLQSSATGSANSTSPPPSAGPSA
jgi:hypothetical protein